MTLAQLKSVVAAYHHKSVSDLTVGGVDLFLVAANNARRNAELKHNFEFARVAATLDITGASGGSLLNATITEGTATARVREIINVSRLNTVGDRRIPLDFTRADIAVERDRSEDEIRDHYEWYYRTPSDADLLNRRGRASVVQRGHQIFVYPIPVTDVDNTPLTLYIEGIGELPEYTAATLVPVSQSFTLTGTLSPDATGDYTATGTFGDAPIYTKGTVDYYLTFINGTWRLQAGTDGFTGVVNYWTPSIAVPVTQLPTSLVPSGAVYTGTATLTDTSDAPPDPDFLLTYGAPYMMWQTIIEMNYLFTTFVPRQEGNLSPPEKMRDQAWNDLLTWDAYLIDSAVTRSRS